MKKYVDKYITHVIKNNENLIKDIIKSAIIEALSDIADKPMKSFDNKLDMFFNIFNDKKQTKPTDKETNI